MSLVATIRALVNAGATPAMLLAVVESNEDALSKRRASDRSRQAAKRTKDTSRDIGGHVDESTDTLPHVGERAPVVLPSLSSLPTEVQKELKPISPDGEITPLKPKSNDFTRFWQAYPSKVGKPVAEKAYAKAIRRIPGPDPPGTLLAGVERAKASRKWLDGIIPNPATWLNQDRWLDEPAEIIPITGAFHDRFDPDAKRARREANSARSDEGAYLAARQRFQP